MRPRRPWKATYNASGGTTIFSGANTYAGTTTIAAGILEIASNHALGSASTGATVSSGASKASAP